QLGPLLDDPRVQVTPLLSDRELRSAYRRARVALFTYRDATASNALLEAMACGLPVVATGVGGIPEYADEDAACLCRPGDGAAPRQARVDLAAAHRLAVMDDLHEGTWNHFSAKVPGDPERILLTPSNTHWSQVTAGSLVELGPEDRDSLRRGGGMPWTAYRIH